MKYILNQYIVFLSLCNFFVTQSFILRHRHYITVLLFSTPQNYFFYIPTDYKAPSVMGFCPVCLGILPYSLHHQGELRDNSLYLSQNRLDAFLSVHPIFFRNSVNTTWAYPKFYFRVCPLIIHQCSSRMIIFAA